MKNKPEFFVYLTVFLVLVLIVVFADSFFVHRVNGVSNVLLSVLTAGYVFLTYWILKFTRQSILEQNRPYVIANLPYENQQVWLSVRNIGNRPALDVKVTFTPSLEVLGGKSELWTPLLTQAFLAPNDEKRNPAGLAFDIVKLDPANKVFRVEVTYYDSERVSYSTKPYKIDLSEYVFAKLVINTETKKS
jgi:prepilin signal peptidase PulO-like enzyme (type II secretory pathway)